MPTMQCEIVQTSSEKSKIELMLKNTKTIAIVGCSPNIEKASNKVAAYLQNAGYIIIPIYPKEDTILGEKVYRNLSDIPANIQVDMIDIFRKPDVIASVIDEDSS
jgi:predicted CoA-binding protein